MLVAIILAVIGILSVITITQVLGYRLGGVIVVPIMAVYALKNFVMLPVFVISALTAYVGLNYVKRKTMIYGRTELVASILIGSVLPVIGLFFIRSSGVEFQNIFFIGSVLPGLAAYNYQHIKPQYRLKDLLTAVGLFLALLGIGWALISPEMSRSIGYLTPPILFSRTSDIAILKGAAVDVLPVPTIMDRMSTIAVFTVSLVLSEIVRAKYGIRTGIVSMGMLAIFALANKWFVLIYLVNLLLAYFAIDRVQKATLLYGRNLIGLGVLTSLLLTVPEVLMLPIVRGSAFFIGIIAGLNGYNLHVTPPAERKVFLPLQLSIFVPTLVFARIIGGSLHGWGLFGGSHFGGNFPSGLLHELGAVEVLLAALLTLAAMAFIKRNWIPVPEEKTVLDASLFRRDTVEESSLRDLQ
ncbi:poly-gamma-glutamate biosynthesis protein PgsC/CapC [Methanosarcina sp. Mfa9]|uniref:poly-gamma-glutamate biosynthesis protein PgsC/CapC n=1 Tax=Methanosarcina sp. Mfa9 TaxID=3439063 RepID=UPI003F83D31A